jgi:hypothetical protein
VRVCHSDTESVIKLPCCQIRGADANRGGGSQAAIAGPFAFPSLDSPSFLGHRVHQQSNYEGATKSNIKSSSTEAQKTTQTLKNRVLERERIMHVKSHLRIFQQGCFKLPR